VDAEANQTEAAADPHSLVHDNRIIAVGLMVASITRQGECGPRSADKTNTSKSNKGDVYNRILELDYRKMEKTPRTPHMACKIHVGGCRDSSRCLCRAHVHNTCTGNAVLVRGDNYVLARRNHSYFDRLCYGLMWIGVIREYRKFGCDQRKNKVLRKLNKCAAKRAAL